MIKLKGMPNSVLRCLIPEKTPAEDLPRSFEELMEQAGQVLTDARVVLDFGGRTMSDALVFSVLSKLVWPSHMTVIAWITYHGESQDLLKRAGLPVSEPPSSKRGNNRMTHCDTLFLDRTLRSGQRVDHKGDVIVSGHVNDGAEICASGHIVVLGRLNGLVHAGSGGDENASIVARSMEALQVRIGARIGSLDKSASWWGKKVIIKVEEGSVLIDYWPALKKENRNEASQPSSS